MSRFEARSTAALVAAAAVVMIAAGTSAVFAQRGGGGRGGAQAEPAAPQNAAATPAPAGNAMHGKELWNEYFCYSCHGSDGQGGAGAKIAPNPPNFNRLRTYVRKPSGGMPPYISKSLPDQDLADIYAYLRTIPAGKEAKDIPLLNQ
jgi:mono/diheme cytochrome c family protein